MTAAPCFARLLIHRQIKLMIGLPKAYTYTPPAESREKILYIYSTRKKQKKVEKSKGNTNMLKRNIVRKRAPNKRNTNEQQFKKKREKNKHTHTHNSN